MEETQDQARLFFSLARGEVPLTNGFHLVTPEPVRPDVPVRVRVAWVHDRRFLAEIDDSYELPGETRARWSSLTFDAFGMVSPAPTEGESWPCWWVPRPDGSGVMAVRWWRFRVFRPGSAAHAELLWLPSEGPRLNVRGLEAAEPKERPKAASRAAHDAQLLLPLSTYVARRGPPPLEERPETLWIELTQRAMERQRKTGCNDEQAASWAGIYSRDGEAGVGKYRRWRKKLHQSSAKPAN